MAPTIHPCGCPPKAAAPATPSRITPLAYPTPQRIADIEDSTEIENKGDLLGRLVTITLKFRLDPIDSDVSEGIAPEWGDLTPFTPEDFELFIDGEATDIGATLSDFTVTTHVGISIPS